MNIRQRLLAGAASILILATSGAWAGPPFPTPPPPGGNPFRAPEIDAASGTSAIALLTGIVLLMKERTRSKRSSKSNKSDE